MKRYFRSCPFGIQRVSLLDDGTANTVELKKPWSWHKNPLQVFRVRLNL